MADIGIPVVDRGGALIDAARRHGASMVVVGAHGGRPLLGVIAPYRLVHRRPVPVLVVPEPEE